jgi:hypothetical protein
VYCETNAKGGRSSTSIAEEIGTVLGCFGSVGVVASYSSRP